MTLESELREEQVIHLDLSEFTQVPSGTLVRDALTKLRANRHNVCLITQDEQLQGIFTDRDVLRKVVASPETLDGLIDHVMTRDPITITSRSIRGRCASIDERQQSTQFSSSRRERTYCWRYDTSIDCCTLYRWPHTGSGADATTSGRASWDLLCRDLPKLRHL